VAFIIKDELPRFGTFLILSVNFDVKNMALSRIKGGEKVNGKHKVVHKLHKVLLILPSALIHIYELMQR